MKAYYLLFLVLLGCSEKQSDSYSTYPFTESDFNYIPTHYEDESLTHTFKDANGDSFSVEISLYLQSLQSGGGIGSESPYFEYEHLIIQLHVIGSECENYEIEISKGPTSLYTEFSLRLLEDPCSLGTSFSFQEPYSMGSYSIGGTSYSKVLTLSTSTSNAISFGGLPVDIVYFDLKQGFLAFKNSSTNQLFELVNIEQ